MKNNDQLMALIDEVMSRIAIDIAKSAREMLVSKSLACISIPAEELGLAIYTFPIRKRAEVEELIERCLHLDRHRVEDN